MMSMLPLVRCSGNQRTFLATESESDTTLKITDVSPFLHLFNCGLWSQSFPPIPDYNAKCFAGPYGAIFYFLFKLDVSLLLCLRCCTKKQFYVRTPTFKG